ncbi:MAG: polysaccharide biosynthesis C-terminal domain-containing protein [Candidatus Acidiferrales bacterium]
MPTDMPTVMSNLPARSNTKIIGRNFLFMGLEVVIMLAATALTTVFIARVIGPVRLGYFNLILWLGSVTCSIGSLGLPLTTFKYYGQFLGRGQPELARAVFFYNLRAQTVLSSCLAALGMVAVFTVIDPAYRVCSALLALAIIPNMVTFIPSQVNTAAEKSVFNARGAFVRAAIYVIAVTLSLLLRWDLVGIAAGTFLSCCAELVVKIVPVLKSMESVADVPVPEDIRKKMFAFSGRSAGLMLVQIVVWDRSDVLFLKLLQSDIRQLAFFSVCFSLIDRLMLPAQAFANSLAATQMAESGRDKASLFKITSHAFMYLLLGALPIIVGVACVSGPFIRVVYGSQYLPAIPVFVVVALLGLPTAVLTPAQTLLYSADDVGFVLKFGSVAAAINMAADILLIPRYGAIGAAWANGIAQTLAATIIWSRVLTRYPVQINGSALLRLLAATLAMAVAVLAVVNTPLGAFVKLAVAVPTGLVVFLVMGRALKMLEKDDRRRLLTLSALVPVPVRIWYERLVNFLVPDQPLWKFGDGTSDA